MKYRISYQDLEHTDSPRFDFHVSISARRKYLFDESLYSITGNLIIADARKARLLAENINKIRKKEGKTDLLVTASMINTLGLLHEIFHFLIRYYEEKVNPGVLARGINYLKSGLSEETLNSILIEFIHEFPPLDVYKRKISAEEYLNGRTENKSNKEIIFEEIILLNLANSNPATIKLEELYSDRPLAQKTRYLNLLEHTDRFFVNEKPFGAENLPLTQFLKKPIISSPHSLDGQLDYIINKWGVYVYEKFHERPFSHTSLSISSRLFC